MAEAFQRWPCVRTLAIVGVEVSRLFVAFRLEQVVDFHYVPTRRLCAYPLRPRPTASYYKHAGLRACGQTMTKRGHMLAALLPRAGLPSKCRLVLSNCPTFTSLMHCILGTSIMCRKDGASTVSTACNTSSLV
ncbi:hypothetical protein GQ600_24499 [Phytophthora cactorum]|nr:hypothetical protein GQ600_24499 [Phytophthora cactorum]